MQGTEKVGVGMQIKARDIGWQAESKTGVVAAGGAGAVAAGIEILAAGGYHFGAECDRSRRLFDWWRSAVAHI